MTFSDNITIYNHRYDKTLDSDVWRRTQVLGVSFYGGQKVNVDSNGLNSADFYIVRIRVESLVGGFVLPDEYNSLPDVANCFTAQNGDVIVKGLISEEITKAADITSHYAESFIITGWHDNRRGAGLKHIRIEGK